MGLGKFNDIETMQQQLRQWLFEELAINNSIRNKAWSESLAVGSEGFVEKAEMVDTHALREQSVS